MKRARTFGILYTTTSPIRKMQMVRNKSEVRQEAGTIDSVSYTHLDVYKRQTTQLRTLGFLFTQHYGAITSLLIKKKLCFKI